MPHATTRLTNSQAKAQAEADIKQTLNPSEAPVQPPEAFYWTELMGNLARPLTTEHAVPWIQDLSTRWRQYGIHDLRTFVHFQAEFHANASYCHIYCNLPPTFLTYQFLEALGWYKETFKKNWKRETLSMFHPHLRFTRELIDAARSTYPPVAINTMSPVHGPPHVTIALPSEPDYSARQGIALQKFATELYIRCITRHKNLDRRDLLVAVRDEINNYAEHMTSKWGHGIWAPADPPAPDRGPWTDSESDSQPSESSDESIPLINIAQDMTDDNTNITNAKKPLLSRLNMDFFDQSIFGASTREETLRQALQARTQGINRSNSQQTPTTTDPRLRHPITPSLSSAANRLHLNDQPTAPNPIPVDAEEYIVTYSDSRKRHRTSS
ncbi:hypothetical protein SISNIDRAFT_471304 [Sistotremastrum niveocremeum HHB9708]|uniref:Uncharacterized protein n=1 Tax=Sistotremastrum niveocremeum HHB9708 TaxID=1314777 RepID=A0A164MTN7_9AGAM|nr:hypothetical protein SISNIDRAFT_471304 [Sistotremastrum niveocremeum HHB9708]